MAENGLEGETIGVIFDGTGYGPDGTIWGGEFLVGGYTGFERKGHFRALPQLGGDAAVREPYRMALSYLYSEFGDELLALPLSGGVFQNKLLSEGVMPFCRRMNFMSIPSASPLPTMGGLPWDRQ